MSEICIKLDNEEVINILSHLDTLLKTSKTRLKDLFDENDKFSLEKIQGPVSVETTELLYEYFTNYSYGELAQWVHKNISIYNSFIQNETQQKPQQIQRCYDTKKVIINSAAWLYKLIKTTKLDEYGGAEINIIFSKDSTLCDLNTYHILVNDFSLSNNLYYSRDIIKEFTLKINIDKISIRMEIEGLDDLYIYLVSQVDFDIYYDDVDTSWPHNYPAKVMKYHDEDYIWIYKSALKQNTEDVKFMLDCVMFACHFPSIQTGRSTLPIYKISSVLINDKDRITIPDNLLLGGKNINIKNK